MVSPDSRWLTPVASTIATISGRMMVYSPGQLEHDDDGRDRGPGGAGEHRPHADQGVGTCGPDDARGQDTEALAEGRPEHGADEQAGREDATGPADPDGQAGGDHLPDQEQQQERDAVAAGDALAQDGIAHAVHLRQYQQESPEEHPADGRAQPLGAAPGPVAQRPRWRRAPG